MRVTLTWAEVEMAAQVGLRRQIESLKHGLPDRHGYTGEGWSIHIEGAGGELAAAKGLSRYWGGTVGTFKDGGDVGDIQIRTRSKPDYELIVRMDDREEDYFVLVVGLLPVYEIVGWIRGADAKRTEWIREYGGRPPAYFVPRESMHVFKSEEPPE